MTLKPWVVQYLDREAQSTRLPAFPPTICTEGSCGIFFIFFGPCAQTLACPYALELRRSLGTLRDTKILGSWLKVQVRIGLLENGDKENSASAAKIIHEDWKFPEVLIDFVDISLCGEFSKAFRTAAKSCVHSHSPPFNVNLFLDSDTLVMSGQVVADMFARLGGFDMLAAFEGNKSLGYFLQEVAGSIAGAGSFKHLSNARKRLKGIALIGGVWLTIPIKD
jgi:hypothetical protein